MEKNEPVKLGVEKAKMENWLKMIASIAYPKVDYDSDFELVKHRVIENSTSTAKKLIDEFESVLFKHP